MTPDLFAIGSGVILLIVAALGGRIAAKKIKVPLIFVLSRRHCALAGVALVATGLYLKTVPTSPPPQPVAATTQSAIAQPSPTSTIPVPAPITLEVPESSILQTPTQFPSLNAEEVPSIGKATEVRFRVLDLLIPPAQISESVEVFIEGKRLGILTVDEAHPTSAIEATVTTPGEYHYSLSGQLRERNELGERVLSLTGSGGVHIDREISLYVYLVSKRESSAVIALRYKP